MPSVSEAVRAPPNVIVLPDSGPLITLAYAGALDVLMKPLWPIKIVDMVLDEVTRNATPTSELIRLSRLRHGCAKIAENRPRNLVRPT